MENSFSYWLVGADWPTQNMLEAFVAQGSWQLSPEAQGKPMYADRFNRIAVNDRVAIKSLGGRSSGFMEIRAIGIVTNVNPGDFRVDIQWIVTGINRKVPLFGCMRALNAPKTLAQHEEFLNLTFRI